MEKFNNLKIIINEIEYWEFNDIQSLFMSQFNIELDNKSIDKVKTYCEKNWIDLTIHCKNDNEKIILSKYSYYVIIDKLNIENKELKRKIKDYFYHKDFEWWNKDKQRVDNNNTERYINKREIWNCKLGINIWNESNWKWKYMRPVLIIERIWAVYFIVPLTKNWKNTWERNSEFYYKLQDNIFDFDSYIMLSQIKTIDKKRLVSNEWTISENDFTQIKNHLKNMYFSND